jgi:hypothetical protein
MEKSELEKFKREEEKKINLKRKNELSQILEKKKAVLGELKAKRVRVQKEIASKKKELKNKLSEFTQAFKKMLKMYVKSLNMSKDVIREFLNDYLKEEDNEDNEDNEEELNKVVLLVLEDNTIQPVLKVNDDLMNIIKEWYNKCDLLLTIEETELSIPKNILNKEKLHDILNTYVNYKDKEKYIQQYIPNEIIKTITKEIAEKLEKEIQVKKITTCEEKELPKPVVETTYIYKVPDNNADP